MEDTRVEFAPEPRGGEPVFRQAIAPFDRKAATKTLPDFYLVGFAEVAGAGILTFDKGLANTARFRRVPLTFLAYWTVQKYAQVFR